MYRSREESGLGVGAFSRSWRVRTATVMAVGAVGTAVGLVLGYPLEGFLLGTVLGVGSAVMGESSMDTGAYKYPEKFS